MENNILTLQIEPIDTLFFRDGKPFSMGDDSWADGILLPHPSVIYGSIRSWILSNSENVTLENVIEETGDVKILDLYYSLRGETVFPLPQIYGTKKEKGKDILYEEQLSKKMEVERFSLIPNEYICSTHIPQLFYNEKQYVLEKPKNTFITSANFVDFLKASDQSNKTDSYFLGHEIEPKIGIKRTNETKASEDGNLYRVGLNRLKDMKIIVRVQSRHLSTRFEKIMKLGGEGKITVINDFLIGKKGATRLRISTGLTSKKLLVYLATPAIFHNGEPDISKIVGVKATLKATSVGKAQNIGGFDMKKKEPKPMYKAVPSGSIYLYELEEEIDFDTLQGVKISDELAEQGFGIAYFGTFK